MSRVLVLASEAVGTRMAGPAIRSWELAATLARTNQVTLATPGAIPAAGPEGVSLIEARQSVLGPASTTFDVMIAQPSAYTRFPALRHGPACRVVDLYDPSVIEDLEIHRDLPISDQRDRQQRDLVSLMNALAIGDYFICASETQRALWLGMLTAAGRVNPTTYANDRTLRSLIDLCPFGLPDDEPRPDPGCLRRRFPAIGVGDPTVLWAGGIWNWFDPLTLLRGMEVAVRTVPRLRLVFLGAGHPEPSVPAMQMAMQAHGLSRNLGLTGRHVFFNDEWVPYSERGAFLLDASFAASLHGRTAEATFAFRTRLLDHLWAGLPSLVTTGDTLGDSIVAAGAGVPVGPGRVHDAGSALIRLAHDAERAPLAANARALAFGHRWSVAIERLAAFCASPRPAPDREMRHRPDTPSPVILRRSRQAWSMLRREGPGALRDRALRFVRSRTR